jgi:hypothetical protein
LKIETYSDLLKRVTDTLVLEYNIVGKNQMGAGKLEQFTNTIDYVLSLLVYGYSTPYKNAPISRSNDYYSGGKHLHAGQIITSRHVQSVLNLMEGLNWIGVTKPAIARVHPHYYSFLPTFLALADLNRISAELVVTQPVKQRKANLELRLTEKVINPDTNKMVKRRSWEALEPSTADQRRMSSNVDLINTYIGKHWLDMELTDSQWLMLFDELMSSRNKRVHKYLWLNRKSLSRVFNSADLSTGGRFYGSWVQTIPSRYRPFITINGKRTQEFDYSSLNPSLAYASVGVQYDGDGYDLADLQEKDEYIERDVVKEAFNAMMQVSGSNLHQKPNDLVLPEGHTSWKRIRSLLLQKHEVIAELFFNGMGGKLQRQDSDIAEEVMLRCIKAGIPVLPIHDSFITYAGSDIGLFLKSTMQDVYREFTGKEVVLKASKKTTPISSLYFNYGDIDVDGVVKANDEYLTSNLRQEIARKYFKY